MTTKKLYYIWNNEAIEGPFFLEELYASIVNQKLPTSVLCCEQGTEQWISAEDILSSQEILHEKPINSPSSTIKKSPPVNKWTLAAQRPARKGPFSALRHQWLAYLSIIVLTIIVGPILVIRNAHTGLYVDRITLWPGITIAFILFFVPLASVLAFIAQCITWIIAVITKRTFECNVYTLIGFAAYLLVIITFCLKSFYFL